MDMDTTRTKDGYEKILSAFSNREADILIGTQMIVKGHDFPNVTLVGVLAADMSLYIHDYHSAERTFQLLTQAAGRAGRGVNRARWLSRLIHRNTTVSRRQKNRITGCSMNRRSVIVTFELSAGLESFSHTDFFERGRKRYKSGRADRKKDCTDATKDRGSHWTDRAGSCKDQ